MQFKPDFSCIILENEKKMLGIRIDFLQIRTEKYLQLVQRGNLKVQLSSFLG